MLRMRKIIEIIKIMEQYNIDLIALQDIRWRNSGCIDKESFKMLYPRENKRGNIE